MKGKSVNLRDLKPHSARGPEAYHSSGRLKPRKEIIEHVLRTTWRKKKY